MASLTTLPTELLLLIFTSCSSISTAVRLSEVSKSLRIVWLENTEHVAREILRPHIPAYDDALVLAKSECGKDASVSQYLPRLFRNAELQQDVCGLWEAHVRKLSASVQDHIATLSSIPAAYYMIRHLVNSYSDMGYQAAMHSITISSSPIDLEARYQLSVWMCTFMDQEEMARQGMLKHEHLFTEDDEERGFGIKDEWEFALNVYEVMRCERARPGFSSPDLPCPWKFGSPCCGEDCRRGETWPYDIRPSSS